VRGEGGGAAEVGWRIGRCAGGVGRWVFCCSCLGSRRRGGGCMGVRGVERMCSPWLSLLVFRFCFLICEFGCRGFVGEMGWLGSASGSGGENGGWWQGGLLDGDGNGVRRVLKKWKP